MQHLKHTLESITGVEIYPLISLLIFFLFFVALGIYVLKGDKKFFEHMSKAPLEESETVNKPQSK